MALTSFDATFDFTFARTEVPVDVDLPPVGGDGGGGIAGAVLPFSTNPGLLASCLHPQGQGWEAWAGVPMSLPGYLLPFIIKVDMPDNLAESPFCTEALTVVDAGTGALVKTLGVTLHRMSDGESLFLIWPGGPLLDSTEEPVSLDTGVYRLKLATAVSEPFRIQCGVCTLLKVRLLNDTRIGDLLYTSFDFQQVFYVEGILSGPTYEESETRSGSSKTGGSLKKSWTLELDGVSEPVADALAMAGLHRLVEVSLIRSDGTVSRSIQAMAYEAKASISVSDTGGYDVSLNLPVSLTSWGATSAATSSCATDGSTSDLVVVECLTD